MFPTTSEMTLCNVLTEGKSGAPSSEMAALGIHKDLKKNIKRRKIKNFTSATVKTTVKKDMRVIELQGSRDLFGRLLCLSTEHSIELDNVFLYPLTADLCSWHM